MKINILVILIFILTVNIYAENLINNPGFEEDAVKRSLRISNWTTAGGDVYELWEKEKHSGGFSVKFWWKGSIYQEIPCIKNCEYKLTAWLLNPASEPLENNAKKFGILKLNFIASNEETIFAIQSKPFDFKMKTGEWYKISVKSIAPPTAIKVRAEFELKEGSGEGVICIDDITLELIRQYESSSTPFSINLDGKWKFIKGDSSIYALPLFDDSEWPEIDVPGKWEKYFPDYNGYGWYRTNCIIPDKLREDLLFLIIGSIDDADEIYFNGELIGSTGIMPPYFNTAWNQKRIYSIPHKLINYNKKNIISVRVFDNTGDGGIKNSPVTIINSSGIIEMYNLDMGKPVSAVEFDEWKKRAKKPLRCKVKKLSNGGWTFLLPDNTPYIPTGIEYEPLSIYGRMDWKKIERDLKLIKDNGFNTISVWCVDFNSAGGGNKRMKIEEMGRLAHLANNYKLFIQFYLNIDRFIHIFPKAVLPDGTRHVFDIDYCYPGYLEFCKNFATRLAMELYEFNNVSTIVVWEEKIGLDADYSKDKVSIHSLFGSKWGQLEFKKWLEKKYIIIENLNRKWGTAYKSFEEAVSNTLLDFYNGVSDDDHRQFDILEFGQIMLIDFTKNFVDAYKVIDPDMLFQCRNWDLFGPVRGLDPRYSFLDSFGVNQYTMGHRNFDISLREEIIKVKLIDGIARTAPYVSNYGFRTESLDKGTHGLVPDDKVKAFIASDAVSLYSFLPEVTGTSYFTYYYSGWEGPWGIIKNKDGDLLPIYYSFKALHSLFSEKLDDIAVSDYKKAPEVFVFHGLDAIYDIRQKTWVEHTGMGYDLIEMNINYKVISDYEIFNPSKQPVIIADFHAYDKKLDSDIAKRLIKYCRNGGNLVISNNFGRYDRHLWPNLEFDKILEELIGIKRSNLTRGKVIVKIPDKNNIINIKIDNTWYIEKFEFTDTDFQVLMNVEINGNTRPGLIKKKCGKGTIYYFLFNPNFHKENWHDKPENFNRASLPIYHFLFNEIGIKHDTNFGNRGFQLQNGRVNVHQKPLHFIISKDAEKFGTYTDEYGETETNYSGGVITGKFISFRGHYLNENGWIIKSSNLTSIYASIKNDKLSFFTADPVELTIKKDGWNIKKKTVKYKVYTFEE